MQAQAPVHVANVQVGCCNRQLPSELACVAGVKRGRGTENLGTQGRKERNACKGTIVFSIFHAQIMSVKIVIGQNSLTVNLRLNTFFRLAENNITPFEQLNICC